MTAPCPFPSPVINDTVPRFPFSFSGGDKHGALYWHCGVLSSRQSVVGLFCFFAFCFFRQGCRAEMSQFSPPFLPLARQSVASAGGRRPRRREMDDSCKTVREAQLSCEMSTKRKLSNIFWNCLKMRRDAFNSATNPVRIRNLSQIRFSSSVSVSRAVSFTVVKLAAHWVNAAFSPAPRSLSFSESQQRRAWTWSLGFHVMIGWSEPPFDGQWSSFECSTDPQRAELTYKYTYF